ncbi:MULTISPECIES: DUF998 domain-containing protein [Micromonospora]|uniref:DUF998 domain-containing protein n=1 Tax=Micromonospora zamorensis TaxID=709883 RepID=A0ABZ1PAR0_9ACTN|nr:MULTISPECIES: DUF998 domain-containing protein [Micromonospora]MBQ0982453.1 DUF998 domain-containing protein [Micromonospora sp. M61]MBQ1040498.1 DUF998 domain-containing protein [Micromonospora sp. C81]TQJ20324.1 uncharacterized protein DUF998 [Micromonospora sp. A202]WSK46514.1 DUF998 domain-containing protein [Micromonospora zamorensis]WTE84816.1 DUF998 domain-containing protein [Micromonospora zamorensis]
MPVTRSTGLLALGGIALAALLTVIGHLEVNDDLNPWALTISDFAVSDRGGVIDVAMVVLALATVALLYGLRRADPPRSRSARTAELLLGAWVGGLLLAAVVPTNEPGTAMTTAAYLHRYASVVAFLALPVSGWLLARRPALTPAARTLRTLVLLSLALAAAMIWSAYPGDRMLIGLAERLLILTEVAVLATVAVTQTRRVTPARGASAGVLLR